MTLAAFKALADEELKWAADQGNGLRKLGVIECPEPLARYLAFLPKALDVQASEPASEENAALTAACLRAKALQGILDEVRAGLGAQAGEETVAAVQRVAVSSAGIPAINVIRALVGASKGEETASAVRRALSEATVAARSEAERALLGSAELLAGVARSVAEGRPWQVPPQVFASVLPIPGEPSVASGKHPTHAPPQTPKPERIVLAHGLMLKQRGGSARVVFSEPQQGRWDVQNILDGDALGPTAATLPEKWSSEFWEVTGRVLDGESGGSPHVIATHWSKVPPKPPTTIAEVTGAAKAAVPKEAPVVRVQTVIPGTVPEETVVIAPALSTWEPDDATLNASAAALTTQVTSKIGRPAVTLADVKRILVEFKVKKGSQPLPKRPDMAFFHFAAREVKA